MQSYPKNRVPVGDGLSLLWKGVSALATGSFRRVDREVAWATFGGMVAQGTEAHSQESVVRVFHTRHESNKG